MKFLVAVKKDDYTAQFSFNTEEERQEFIEVTTKMHPAVEILLRDEDHSDTYLRPLSA